MHIACNSTQRDTLASINTMPQIITTLDISNAIRFHKKNVGIYNIIITNQVPKQFNVNKIA